MRNKIRDSAQNPHAVWGQNSKDQKQGSSDNIDLGWMILETFPNMEHRQPIGEQTLDH